MKKIITLCLLVTQFALPAFSETIEVPAQIPGIQQAIDYAVSGDTVLVAPGTYFENIRFMGKNIVVASHFILENDPSFILSTVINGSQPVYPDTASCVMFIDGEDSTAVLTGFTLTGGTGTKWEDEHYLGHWYTEGGGILVQYSSPTIRYNLIMANEAIAVPAGTTSAGGGAVRSGDSNPQILNNVIMNNQGRYGAGIVLNYSGAVIRNNIIIGNTGGEDYGGGGIWILGNGTNPKLIENNTIVNNHATNYGGGIRIWSSTVTITNCIFWGNTAPSSPQIQGTGGTVTYSCVEGGYAGIGNLEDDPVFSGEQFMLYAASPCIDAGNPAPEFYDPEDPQNSGMAQYPSQGELINDMGAYGGPLASLLPELIVTGIATPTGPEGDSGVKVYPNPTSGGLLFIETNLSDGATAAVSILDGLGNRVCVAETAGGDQKVITLPVGDLLPGLYLVIFERKSGWKQVEKLIIQ